MLDLVILGDDYMNEQIERLRIKLNKLVVKDMDLNGGEALEVSKQLDKLIYYYYKSTMLA